MNQNPEEPTAPQAGAEQPSPQGAPFPPPPGPYYYPPPPPRDRRRWLLPVSCAIGCLPWLIIGLILMGLIFAGAAPEEYQDHVALIRISGMITASKSGSSLLSGAVSGSEDIVEQLEKARTSDKAKAVVLRINSPGGSPAGSEEIYNAVNRLRKTGKPVFASMGDVAASGGYYAACACRSIYADSSTITGSIGVLYESADLSGLFKKIGMAPETVKSGKFKDLGTPNRPLTAEERRLIQGIVDDTYARFVEAVAQGRGMPVNRVRKIADGRVFTGTQARKLGLVDDIGGLHETVLAAAAAAGIEGVPHVVDYRKRGWLETFLDSEAEGIADRVEKEAARRLLNRLLDDESSVWRGPK